MIQETTQIGSRQNLPVINVASGNQDIQWGQQQTQEMLAGKNILANGQGGLWQPAEQRRSNGEINVGSTERTLSTLGGTALLLYALQRRDLVPSLLGGAVGLELLYRGVTGHCHLYDALNINSADQHDKKGMVTATRQNASKGNGLRVDAAVTVSGTIEEAYAYWRNLENLPKFMWHVKEVRTLDDHRSHWLVEVSPKIQLEWDARITQDLPNQLIAWHTEPGSVVEHGGAVRFKKAPGERGTEIHATIRYEPPGGILGEAVAGLFQRVTQQQVKEDIRRFKQMLEAGEIAITEGQPRCE